MHHATHAHSRPGPTAHAPSGPDGRWRALVLLCAAQFMLIVDVTVVNVALPSIAQDLALGRSALTWVVAAYALLFGGLLLLGGRLADGLGRRRAFLVGLALFTAASLACGLAPDGSVLIAARAVQGVGAALLSPAAMSIITTTFHGPERTRALGVWGAIGGTGAAIGVLFGGALTAGPGWAWVFFVNVPVGIAILLLLPRFVPAAPPANDLRGLDVPGAATGTAAAGLLVYGLVRAGDAGWRAPATFVPLLAATLCAVAFALLERRVSRPLAPLPLLASRAVAVGTLVMLTASSLLLAAFFLSSWYLQHRLGFSALKTGLVFLPIAVATVLGAHTAAHLLGRVGSRPTAAGAFTVAGAGAAYLTRLPADGSVATDLLPGFLLLAAGLGAGFVSATTTAMRGVEHRDAGLVSGIVNTGHELGGALGVALASVIAGSGLTGFGGMGGIHTAFTVSAIAAAAMALLALLLVPAGKPDTPDGPIFAH